MTGTGGQSRRIATGHRQAGTSGRIVKALAAQACRP
tara:strand:+ start:220 stop:327 length:108 start_codon:yes stop_codon:yes gene_type:complete